MKTYLNILKIIKNQLSGSNSNANYAKYLK